MAETITLEKEFYVGENVKFKLNIRPINQDGIRKLDNISLWQRLPGENDYTRIEGFNHLEESVFKGELLIRRGDLELKLSQSNATGDWRIPVLSARVFHPDEQRNEIWYVVLAFMLSAACSLIEIAVQIWSVLR